MSVDGRCLFLKGLVRTYTGTTIHNGFILVSQKETDHGDDERPPIADQTVKPSPSFDRPRVGTVEENQQDVHGHR